MRRWEELARIRLDEINRMKSPKAQAIYTYLPSRALHHTKDSPFSIKLANVLPQIGAPVPIHKSVRKKIFIQNDETSILNQLNNAEVADGILRVELEETRDGSDYKLISWVEREEAPQKSMPSSGNSKMLDAWLEGGRPKQSFDDRLRKSKPLSGHYKSLLERTGAELKGSERFFEMAAALLGPQFEQILSETKGDVLAGDRGDNPTKRLNYRIMEALRRGPLG